MADNSFCYNCKRPLKDFNTFETNHRKNMRKFGLFKLIGNVLKCFLKINVLGKSLVATLSFLLLLLRPSLQASG